MSAVAEQENSISAAPASAVDKYKYGYYYKTALKRASHVPSSDGSTESDGQERDWQAEWSSLVERQQTGLSGPSVEDASARLLISQQLSELSQDFVSIAKRYGKLIIAERFVPDNLKVRVFALRQNFCLIRLNIY